MTAVWEYVTAPTDTVHLIEQGDPAAVPVTLCGRRLDGDWIRGDETVSGGAATCGICLTVVSCQAGAELGAALAAGEDLTAPAAPEPVEEPEAAAGGELTAREWIYLGRYSREKGPLGSKWLDHRDKTVLFGKAPRGGIIGGVYEVRCTADSGSAVIADARWVRSLTGDERVAGWRLDDKRAYLEDEGRKAAARAKRDNGDLEQLTLGQVRQLMLTAGGLRRGAILAAVLGYIEGGSL